MSKKQSRLCPCGSSKSFDDCCGRYIEGHESAPTPEALMRSRYSAYSIGNRQYLLDTWHPSTRPQNLEPGNESTIKWTELTIVSAPNAEGDTGFVEYIARFKDNGRAGKLHERSRFSLQDNCWFYIDGEIE